MGEIPKEREPHRESNNFHLTVVVHRHGPREGVRLTSSGINQVQEYYGGNQHYAGAYEGVALDTDNGVDVVYSNIDTEVGGADRVRKTAEISAQALRAQGKTVQSIRADSRLSEGPFMREAIRYALKQHPSKHYISAWMHAEKPTKKKGYPDGMKTGSEMAAHFADWLLECIENKKTEGRRSEIDAFSHYPVMLAFLYSLEKKTGLNILPSDWQKDYSKNQAQSGVIDPLGYFNMEIDSKNASTLRLNFNNKTIDVPLKIIEEIRSGNVLNKQ